MVRILAKRLVVISLIILVEFVPIATLQTIFSPKASAAPTYQVLAASGDTGSAAPRNNSGQFFTYYGYRSQINNINGGWAPRSACSPPDNYTTYKTLPWVSDSRAAGTGIDGNIATTSGDCQTGVTDGGWSNNAWLRPNVMNWAVDGTGITLSGSVYSGPNNWGSLCGGTDLPCSNKLQYCSSMKGSGALPIWGNRTQDNNDHSNNYWTANWGSGTGYSNMFLYSHGVTLVRNNFNLTNQDIANLSNGSNTLDLEVQADDWFRMYLNGVLVSTTPASNDSSSGAGAYVNINIDAYKSLLRTGENNVAFEVVDKARWDSSGTAIARGAGMCYSLTLSVNTVVTPITCTPSADQTINAGNSATISFSSSNGASYSWSGAVTGSGTPKSVTVTPASTTTYTATVTSGSQSRSCSTTVTVNPAPPTTCTLAASPNTVTLGYSTNLAWTYGGGPDTATLNGVSILAGAAASGTMTVTPTSAGTTTYDLILVKAGFADKVCSQNVTVNPPSSGPGSNRRLGPWDSITNMPPVL